MHRPARESLYSRGTAACGLLQVSLYIPAATLTYALDAPIVTLVVSGARIYKPRSMTHCVGCFCRSCLAKILVSHIFYVDTQQ